jgi:hypothetical protein
MPSLQYFPYIPRNFGANQIQLSRRKTIIVAEREWTQPILAYHFLALNVDMLRLIAVETIKEEPVWAGNILDGWH